MSPSSSSRSTAAYGPVGARDFSGVDLLAGGFGVRKHQASSSPPLKVSKDSHRIRKPPLPLPPVQYRPPVIIHTYSPKVLHTEPDDFMSLVQILTGSSDTRLRLKKTKSSKKTESPNAELPSEPIRPAAIQRQGSGSSSVATSTCGSPSSSSEENFVATESVSELGKVVKQSNSPRSPFDSDFEFESNDSGLSGMFSHFDNTSSSIAASVPGSSAAPGMFQVKAEPMFSFTEPTNPSSFNVFTDAFMMKQMPRQQPQMHPLDALVFDPNPSAHLLSALPDLAWSLDGSAPHFINQAPYLRQRAYGPSTPEGTLVSLENLHAYSLN